MHYLSIKKGILKSELIAFIPIGVRHTGANIATFLLEALKDLNIPSSKVIDIYYADSWNYY